MQLFALALTQGIERGIMAADQTHELLRIHLVTVTAGILMGHGRAMDVVRLRGGWFFRALI